MKGNSKTERETAMDHISDLMDGLRSKNERSSTSESVARKASSLIDMPYRRLGPAGYEHCDWHGVRNLDDVLNRIGEQFRAGNQSPKFPIYLFGGVGRGKTGLAAVLYRIASRPIWRRSDTFLLDLSTGRSDETYRVERRKAVEASLLVLDDLCVRKPSEGMFHMLFDLLEDRKGRPTVITSNKTPDELDEMYPDGRIHSRIFLEGLPVVVRGEDRRAAGEEIVVYSI
jgi:DNA replication protein DnaC